MERTAVIFGGSSGIGEATARMLVGAGTRVTIVGRDEAKLAAAKKRIGDADTIAADAHEAADVKRVFDQTGTVDDVVICVSGGKGAGPFHDLDLELLLGAFEAKTIAQLRVAQIASRHVRPGGSITFVTAGSARSKIRNTAGLAAVNGALEAAIPILALELAPIRVNAVSPGIIETPWWDAMPAAAKEQFFAAATESLPVGRVGHADDVARVIATLTQAGFVTGSIYEVDGGGHLVTQ